MPVNLTGINYAASGFAKCPISNVNVTFVSDNGTVYNCSVLTRTDTTISCAVPAGQGSPQVFVTICGQTSLPLPRY